MTRNELNKIASYLSEAFLQAVCVRAGLSFQFANRSFDDLGLDGIVQKTKNSCPIGKQYQFQLKACYSKKKFVDKKDHVKYAIGEEFFDRMQQNMETVILVVIRLPVWSDDYEKTVDSWFGINQESLQMTASGYFVEIDYKDKANFIKIPKSNLLTPKNLLDFIDKKNNEVLKNK